MTVSSSQDELRDDVVGMYFVTKVEMAAAQGRVLGRAPDRRLIIRYDKTFVTETIPDALPAPAGSVRLISDPRDMLFFEEESQAQAHFVVAREMVAR